MQYFFKISQSGLNTVYLEGSTKNASFLDASLQLYKRVCSTGDPSVGRSVGQLVHTEKCMKTSKNPLIEILKAHRVAWQGLLLLGSK